MSIRSVIRGVGHAVPEKILTNADLEQIVETNDEWIVQRTGIKERRVTGPEEFASTLSITAAQEALSQAGMTGDDIDLVIVGTVTGDFHWPSTACLVQDAIGAHHAGAFDVSAACAGFIYSLANADALLKTGMGKRALVIGVDTLSKQVDWTDRGTCILFGDAAGAVVMEREENTDRGLLETVLMSDGSGWSHIVKASGGSRFPYGAEWTQDRSHKIFMAGKEVYRFGVQAMGDACLKVIEKAGVTPDEVDLFVPHQANVRIIDSAAKRIGLPDEKVFVNVEKYGNTSGGSVPLALYEAQQSGRLKPGMLVLTVGFGAGLVWGANLIRW